MAAAGEDRTALARTLLTSKEDGRIKLYVTTVALHCRRTHPGLFATGDYLPAQASGAKREHVFGFVRRQGDHWALVVVPRLMAPFLHDGHAAPLGKAVWRDTTLRVPGPQPSQSWRNVLTGARLPCAAEDGQPLLEVAELFAHCPVALLVAERS
jgi:(1->4)-alpha-D-glucan 1-alpha-D-glucosylmutase